MARGVSLDDVPTGGNDRKRGPSDTVELHKFSNKLEQIRLVEPIAVYGTHTIRVRKRDGSYTTFPTPCIAWDPETNKRDSTKECPWCKHLAAYPSEDKDNRNVGFSQTAFANGFTRKAQKEAPEPTQWTKKELKTGHKDKESDTPTIWEVFRLPGTILTKLKEFKQLNVVEKPDGSSVNVSVMHPKFGMDVRISYNKDLAPAQQYSVLPKEGRSKVTAQDLEYPQWDIFDLYEIPSLEEAKADYMSWADRYKHPNVYARSSNGRASQVLDDDDDPDDDNDSGLDDDGGDEPVTRRHTSRSTNGSSRGSDRRAQSRRDEPDDLDDDDPDQDEADTLDDDEPVTKPRSTTKPVSRNDKPQRQVRRDEPDDPDDEADNLDESDATPVRPRGNGKPAPRSNGKPTGRAQRRDEPDDLDDDDQDPDDDDGDAFADDPQPRRSTQKPAGRSSTKPAQRPQRRAEPVEDDEEDVFADL